MDNLDTKESDSDFTGKGFFCLLKKAKTAEQKSMVTLLAFNEKCILKFFIAKKNSTATILDGNVYW